MWWMAKSTTPKKIKKLLENPLTKRVKGIQTISKMLKKVNEKLISRLLFIHI